MYDIEEFYVAESVEDAVSKKILYPEAIIISGGSDVLIKIREGHFAGKSLISIHDIASLKGVEKREDGTIVIGPATTFTEIEEHPLIRDNIAVLGEAVSMVGSPQIRNIGTIGGNVCNGVTSADSASTLFALNAKLELTGKDRKKTVPIEEFYIGPGKTTLEKDELLTAILIEEKDYKNHYGNYIKYGKRNAMEIATLGCVVVVELSKDKQYIEDIRIAFGVAAPTPIRCKNTENQLRGKKIEESVYRTIYESVVTEVNPRSSWRASKEFRLQLISELSMRALKEAVDRAGKE